MSSSSCDSIALEPTASARSAKRSRRKRQPLRTSPNAPPTAMPTLSVSMPSSATGPLSSKK
jgi:hypothetical protein